MEFTLSLEFNFSSQLLGIRAVIAVFRFIPFIFRHYTSQSPCLYETLATAVITIRKWKETATGAFFLYAMAKRQLRDRKSSPAAYLSVCNTSSDWVRFSSVLRNRKHRWKHCRPDQRSRQSGRNCRYPRFRYHLQ